MLLTFTKTCQTCTTTRENETLLLLFYGTHYVLTMESLPLHLITSNNFSNFKRNNAFNRRYSKILSYATVENKKNAILRNFSSKILTVNAYFFNKLIYFYSWDSYKAILNELLQFIL